MLAEHDLGRDHVKAISKAFSEYQAGHTAASAQLIDHAKGYIALMLAHIDKEDHVLYPMGDSRFSEETQETLLEAFEKIERIGIGKLEQFHKMIDKLSKMYL